MSVKRALLLAAGLLAIWLIGVLDYKFRPSPEIRFINDNYDREIYFRVGSWIAYGQVPYRDTGSEYPQIPTYLFALPYLGLSWRIPMQALEYKTWIRVFSFGMLALLFAEILLLHRMTHERKYLAFLLLLPAYLYFTYNRFDILPAVICLIGYWLLSRNQFNGAAVLLGIGTMTKWYPALLFPLFLVYAWRVRGKIPWGMIFCFAGSCLVFILPTLVLAGWKAFWAPYQFHSGREMIPATLPGVVDQILDWFPGYPAGAVQPLFLVLQFAPSLLILFGKPDTPRKVLNGINVVIAGFFLFTFIYSPQWLLWLVPFLLLSAEDRWDIAWIVAGGTVTYLAFPVFFDLFGIGHPIMTVMGILQTVFLTRTIFVSLRRFRALATD